ncbi:hypothetical protein BG011_003139 [Mortierella polycephala]|uniref:F-box domain-containing protein n=1 Tax=Mortierella polycephala TaxID=41804 RepID=A0A9P6QEK2_9FUNG|nr:hypothetical protein BG011_003139 [Mortierella polycephala]
MTDDFKDQALKSPEILSLIGQFLPLWEKRSGDVGGSHTWKPKDLIACSCVSRLWRATVLPILYRHFVPHVMNDVPLEVLRAMSGHIRVLDAMVLEPMHYPVLAFLATHMNQLEELSMIWIPVLLRPILELNSNLKILRLEGDRRQRVSNMSESIQLSAIEGFTYLVDTMALLMHLKNLRELYLVRFICNGDTLYKILHSMPLLTILSFWDCDGSTIPPFDVPNLSVQDLRIGHSGSGYLPYALLMSVMPNLKSLTNLVDLEQHHEVEECLILKDDCHKVKTLHLEAPAADGTPWMTELISNATSPLEQIFLQTESMALKIINALISHGCGLVNISLVSTFGGDDDPAALRVILVSCPNLRVFRGGVKTSSYALGDIIFCEPWACIQLRTLEIQGLYEHDPEEYDSLQWGAHRGNILDSHSLPERWILSQARQMFVGDGDWTLTFSEDRRRTRQTFAFHVQLLQHVQAMVDLREVIVNDSRYTLAPPF